jgi:hypothetical protein
MKPVSIPRGEEKAIQRALLHYRDPSGYDLVKEGLKLAGREDLIGDGPLCLINRKKQVRTTALPGRREKRTKKNSGFIVHHRQDR